MARQDNIVGRYIYLTIQEIEYRVYYEEAGQGIPILLGHTAGADSRQYRHLLSDEEVTKNFRCIAFDLPYHGKSLPPYESKVAVEEYYLKKQFFMDFVNTLANALELVQPVYMGMSIGGYLAADLALHYPKKYRAVIGIGAALASSEEYDPSKKVESPNAIIDDIKLNISPYTAIKDTNELLWINRTNTLEIFYGDQYYYNYEHYIREKEAKTINTKECMFYLLAGEYDQGTPPLATEKLANLIKGSKFWQMDKLGHFPVIENYSEFRKYLLKVLNEMASS
ncbi:hypothetical protein GCM10025886_18170 [Tetragenococcus halophilus subsp. flandriensis]|uniref:alpha/beta fold hydrolase n=1 Tax=Tetragenococcus halophilus TaxID=51669 RepID=UPI0023E951E6|nr:alpha/beta hydrolase [Tetragenococcus halophilus]GMA08666.1 hypothetical protein GCM10025886_18170 [Tetragenococcus halophilus subsp. flandriensis]